MSQIYLENELCDLKPLFPITNKKKKYHICLFFQITWRKVQIFFSIFKWFKIFIRVYN